MSLIVMDFLIFRRSCRFARMSSAVMYFQFGNVAIFARAKKMAGCVGAKIWLGAGAPFCKAALDPRFQKILHAKSFGSSAGGGTLCKF